MKIKSYLLSFAKAKGSIAAVALAAVLMAANATVASAQNKATESNGTGNTIEGVDKPYGIDPSSAICTTKHTDETDGDKIVCLYNVGAKKFLSVGGMWGTHASLDVTPYPIYMAWNGSSQTYFLESKVKGSAKHPYLGIDNTYGQVFMDTYDGEKSAIRFEKAKDYDSKTNKVYLVKIGNKNLLGYLTAYPNNESKLCDYQKTLAAEGTQEYKNQEWKVITKNEYYLLFNAKPGYMKSPVDASFLIACPEFRANNADATKWLITGKDNDLPGDWKSHVRFGDENMYKTHAGVESTGSNSWVNYKEAHQRDYGQYFYCYTKGLRGFTFYQDVQVHKAGWYLLRCNGFSTANSSENIATNQKPLANLFIKMVNTNSNDIIDKYSTAAFNGISQADAEALGNTYDKAGIGHAFFEGKYENQVQICIDKDPNGKEITSENPVTLRIGFYVDPTPDGKPEVAEDELTAVDNFKLLYAGPRRSTELILDEESTDLRYLTEAADEYTNTVLHLNRKLNDNMWNSLILPVDLTWGQMKRTFGDAVKVAKLAALTENSVQFVTVEPDSDDDVMVTAFEPYIVFPPYTQVNSIPYTAEHFYTSEGENNSEWLGEDYNPSKDEKNRLTKTINANHYDITMVTLDRKKLTEHLKTNWESTTTFSTTGGGMVCKGTMAKTYDNGKILSDRDDLNGDYFMYKGKLIQVPHGKKDNGEKYSYGLKAFRCWFELTDNRKQSQVSLLIDGVEDSTTGIDDIHGNTDCTSYKRGIDGVFNMNGQMVRRSCSLEGLPKGMYVVNGKKIIIR